MWEQHVENHSYLHGERRGCMRNNLLLHLQQNVPKVNTYSFVCLQHALPIGAGRNGGPGM